MPLSLSDLALPVRLAMAAELDYDLERGTVYLSPRLTPPGADEWPEALRAAIEQGNDATLAASLGHLLHHTETRVSARGKVTSVKVPYNAAETLAEGEFNRYFIRGLARYALETGVTAPEVYRAKPVANPRFESERLIGRRLSAERLLADLRTNRGVDTALGVPSGPNSGLSVRIPMGANVDTA